METFGIRSLWIASVLLVYSQPVRSEFPMCYDRPLWPGIYPVHYSRGQQGTINGFYYTTALSDCRTYCRDTRNTTFFGIRRGSTEGYDGDIRAYINVRCYCGNSVTSHTAVSADRCSLVCETNRQCGGPVLEEMSAYSVCPPGKYGHGCSLDCRRDCDGGECYPDSGHCCPAGTYGTECSHNCSNDNCKDGPCDSVSGDCLTGCTDDQWYNEKCDNPCNSGSRYCAQQTCDQNTRVCLQGCQAGYYGSNCSTSCPTNCKNNMCDNISGHCISIITVEEGQSLPTWVYAVIAVLAVAVVVALVVTLVLCLRRRTRQEGSSSE